MGVRLSDTDIARVRAEHSTVDVLGRLGIDPPTRWSGGADYMISYPCPRHADSTPNCNAQRFLTMVEAAMHRDEWTDPALAKVPLAEYAERWIDERPGPPSPHGFSSTGGNSASTLIRIWAACRLAGSIPRLSASGERSCSRMESRKAWPPRRTRCFARS